MGGVCTLIVSTVRWAGICECGKMGRDSVRVHLLVREENVHVVRLVISILHKLDCFMVLAKKVCHDATATRMHYNPGHEVALQMPPHALHEMHYSPGHEVGDAACGHLVCTNSRYRLCSTPCTTDVHCEVCIPGLACAPFKHLSRENLLLFQNNLFQ